MPGSYETLSTTILCFASDVADHLPPVAHGSGRPGGRDAHLLLLRSLALNSRLRQRRFAPPGLILAL
jgi:hypothetical protein